MRKMKRKPPAKSDRESALDLGKIATTRLKSSDANDKENEMHSYNHDKEEDDHHNESVYCTDMKTPQQDLKTKEKSRTKAKKMIELTLDHLKREGKGASREEETLIINKQ